MVVGVKTGFRPDLEGLRGVAVALVVLFHFDLLGVRAGFVGVDVFYVLSGFLISGLLFRELETTGGLDLVAFYARRARRILPAATVATVAILAAATFVVAPLDLPLVAVDATASGLFVGNVLFALRATDYFAARALSPFLHYWSLGVEEQFYLFWPLFVLVAARLRRAHQAILATFALSLALSIALTGVAPAWSFYGLPTRAWELALGALLALHPFALARLRAAIPAIAGWGGLALVLGAALAIDPADPYPGTAALLPAAGAALTIVSSGARGPAILLTLPPVRWLGRVSYSLYLYHWPVFVLAAIALGDLPVEMRVAGVACSLALAQLSRRYVEEPFLRRLPRLPAPRRSLALAGSAICGVVLVAQLVGATAASSLAAASSVAPDPAPVAVVRAVSPTTEVASLAAPSDGPTRAAPTVSAVPATIAAPSAAAPTLAPASRALSPADARSDVDGLAERGCGLSLAGDRPPRCMLGDPDGRATVALVGDSHAAQWSPALEEIARSRHWRLVPFTKDSCIFLDMRIVSLHLDREYTECASWRENVVAELERLDPDLIVVSSSRWVHPVDPRDADRTRQADAMARLLGRLPGRVAIVADTPLPAVDVPACLSRPDRTPAACSTGRGYALTAHLLRDGPAAATAGAALIDPSVWLCDDGSCPAVIDGTIAWRDDHHVTATMARRLAPFLERALVTALDAR